MSDPIEPTRNDPTPERRTGDSRFLPVVVAFVLALIIVLIGAVALIRAKRDKALPGQHNPTPTSPRLPGQPNRIRLEEDPTPTIR